MVKCNHLDGDCYILVNASMASCWQSNDSINHQAVCMYVCVCISVCMLVVEMSFTTPAVSSPDKAENFECELMKCALERGYKLILHVSTWVCLSTVNLWWISKKKKKKKKTKDFFPRISIKAISPNVVHDWNFFKDKALNNLKVNLFSSN